jgi:rhodanese-related sulfurtransferase
MKKLNTVFIALIMLFLLMSYANAVVIPKQNNTANTAVAALIEKQGYINITVGDAWHMTQSVSNGKQIPIDIRRDDEWIVEHIQTPYPQHAQHWANLQLGENLHIFLQEYQGKEIIIYCRTGVRSYIAVNLLIANGFNGVIYHMLGGIVEWKSQQLPTKPNQAPETPTISGPSNGEVGITYDYILTTFDSDYAQIYYHINWGTLLGNEIIGPVSSTDELIASYTWNRRGNFDIKVKAVDRYDAESDWATLSIVMPVSYHPFMQLLQRLIMKYPNLSLFLNLIIDCTV